VLFANDLPKIELDGCTGVFGLLISKRRLILNFLPLGALVINSASN